MKKSLVLSGHLAFLITGILAIIFYKERSLYVDSGQLIFEMLNEGTFKIFLGRYSMYITETIPWLAIKTGASLRTVLVLFSMSFIVVQYLCYLICIYGFKNVEAGMSIALAPLLLRICFGQAVCEPWMAIGYSAVFYALFNRFENFRQKGKGGVLLFYGLIWMIIAVNYFIHPLSLFMLVFSLGLSCISNNLWKCSQVYVTFFFLVSLLCIKFFFPSHPYEAAYFEGLRHPFTLLPVLHKTPMIIFIRRHFGELFIFFLIPLAFSLGFVLKQRKYTTAVFVLVFCLFYITLISLATYKGDSDLQLEIRLIPLIFMAIVPLIRVVKDMQRSYSILSGMCLLSMVSYLYIIHSMHKNHTRRLDTYTYFLKAASTYTTTKFFVKLPHPNTPLNSWGSAAETLMLSSLDGPSHSKTIIFIDDDMHIEEGIHSYPCMFLWLKWRLYVNEDTYLNKKYFNLQCNTYQELKYPEDLK